MKHFVSVLREECGIYISLDHNMYVNSLVE